MEPYRYVFDRKRKKARCPNCGRGTYVLLMDSVTGDHLPEEYGICDRENKCGHRCYPGVLYKAPMIPRQQVKKKSTSDTFIPFEVLKDTLTDYADNVFVQNLLNNIPYPFGLDAVQEVIEMYYLGTVHGHQQGCLSIPYIDKNNNITAVQVKSFDRSNHTTRTTFLHSLLIQQYKRKGVLIPQWLLQYDANEKKVRCLFGEHLLRHFPTNPIGLVEAPKTATICSLYFGLPKGPKDLLWLGVYNKGSFTYEKLRVLHGRTVLVFPDLSRDHRTYQEWENKARIVESYLPGTRFQLSDLIERHSTPEAQIDGLDIADFLIQLDWEKFQTEYEDEPALRACEQNERNEALEQKFIFPESSLSKIPEPPKWDNEIDELQEFYENIEVPQDLNFNTYSRITDVRHFIDTHLRIISANNRCQGYLPYLQRLQELKQKLSD